MKKPPYGISNSLLVLKFSLSQVSPVPGKVGESFQGHAENRFYFFGQKYGKFLDDKYFRMMQSRRKPHQKLVFLLDYAGKKGCKSM